MRRDLLMIQELTRNTEASGPVRESVLERFDTWWQQAELSLQIAHETCEELESQIRQILRKYDKPGRVLSQKTGE